VDCKSFQELISAAVDRQLTESEMAAFVEHGRLCSPCRYEFDAESATKLLVRQRARRVQAPALLARQISAQLDQNSSSLQAPWLRDFFRKPFVRPVVGFALAFIAVLFLLNRPISDAPYSSASMSSNNVILQSLMNHLAVVDGRIKPQVVSSEPAQLQALFAGITDYAVHMPRMKDCRLLGGVQDEYGGIKLAHLVYQHDSDIVYVYQTCLATVMRGEKLSVPPAAKEELERTGWFTESEPDGRTIVLWEKGRTLCAAVARMDKKDLISCLTSEDNTP
jgi:Putative zinc-finger